MNTLCDVSGRSVCFEPLEPRLMLSAGHHLAAGKLAGLTKGSPNSLTGRYNSVSFLHDAGAGTHEVLTAAGYVTFAGDGTWDSVVEAVSLGVPPGPDSGTYSIDVHNRILIDGTETGGMVSPNGEILSLPNPAGGGDLDISFLIQSSAGLTIASLNGRYNFAAFHHAAVASGGDEVDMQAGYVTFNGAGSMTVVFEKNSAGAPDPNETHAYSVDTDGRLFLDGQQSFGMVSPNTQEIVIPDLDASNDVGFIFLVKAAPAVTAANLSGRYNADEFNHEAAGHSADELDADAARIILDGKKGVIHISEQGDDGADTTSYSVGLNNRITVKNVTSYGMVSPNFQVAVLPQFATISDNSLGVSFMIKAPAGKPDLTGHIDGSGLPANVVPGDRKLGVIKSVPVYVINEGDVATTATITIDLYASLDTTLDKPGDTKLLPTITAKLKLGPGQYRAYSFKKVICPVLAHNSYYLIADIDTTNNAVDEVDENNNAAPSGNTVAW